jgi:hypothetical protein
MIEVGTVVRVKGEKSPGTAKVELFIGNVTGSVYLDVNLAGYRYWNTEDLEEV